MTNLEALILLNMFSLWGAVSIRRAVEALGSAVKVFSASQEELLKIEGIKPAQARQVKDFQIQDLLDKELKLARKNGIDFLTILDKDYPENLKNIYDPPVLLYVKGKINIFDNNSIALVGSRRASLYGINTAGKLAQELARLGITVVSGLARGIDTAAHKGALGAGGRTIAVLGSGLLNIYPEENKKLADDIAQKGAVVSEYSLNASPLPSNFPRRNRIVSGLTLGTVIVEASRNSGALITARLALEQNREVFAVPGRTDSENSFGTHYLLKQGAKLVSSVEDILEEISLKITPPDIYDYEEEMQSKKTIVLEGESEKIYRILSSNPLHMDEIIQLTKLSMGEASSLLLKLQLKKLVRELPGKKFVRN